MFLVDALTDGTWGPIRSLRTGPSQDGRELRGWHTERGGRQYVRWNCSGALVAATSDLQLHCTMVVWNGLTGDLVASYNAHSATYALAWSPKEPHIVAFAERNGFVHIMNVETLAHQTIRFSPYLPVICGICFALDGMSLVVGTRAERWPADAPASVWPIALWWQWAH